MKKGIMRDLAYLIDAALFKPHSLQYPGAWVGHLPFAAWVIGDVTPRIFVELGVYSGNSYFSFCQSVLERGLATKCYAVDTWVGDEHSSEYGEDVFVYVNAYNGKHFAAFSKLLRMTFDEAVKGFEDESIDLLHIDGLHTYEAVRHDFETWLPKLAPGERQLERYDEAAYGRAESGPCGSRQSDRRSLSIDQLANDAAPEACGRLAKREGRGL
jgi:hypothetical protein